MQEKAVLVKWTTSKKRLSDFLIIMAIFSKLTPPPKKKNKKSWLWPWHTQSKCVIILLKRRQLLELRR